MMILAVTMFAAAVTVAPMIDPKSVKSIAPVCQQLGPRRVAGTDGALYREQGRPLTRRLDQEPNADVTAAVLYTEGSCSKPIVISRDIGLEARRKGNRARP